MLVSLIQALRSRRIQCGFHRVKLHRPTSGGPATAAAAAKEVAGDSEEVVKEEGEDSVEEAKAVAAGWEGVGRGGVGKAGEGGMAEGGSEEAAAAASV